MPVALVELPAVEPLMLPVVPVALLPRSRSRGAFASLEVDRRIELSVALRPLARFFDFVLPMLLQSQLHLSSLADVSEDEATFRSDVVAEDEVDSEPRSEVLLSVEVLARGCVLSDGAALSFGGLLTLAFGRSSRVCAIATGAARARARITASFMCCLRES